jgi:Nif-specific regulatory protein
MSTSTAAQTGDWLNPHGSEVRKLATLLEVSQGLLAADEFQSGLMKVLEALGDHHGAIRSTVALTDPQSRAVTIAATAGVVDGDLANHQLGEWIASGVVQTGRPAVLPRVSHEPMFQRSTVMWPVPEQHELSYICVPIMLDRRPVGALGVDLLYKPHRDYERTVKFLGVVASMIAYAIKVHQMVEADRRVLTDENRRLRLQLEERYGFSNIVGTSRPMQELYEQITQVAPAHTTVLLRGESGTGKELIAHAIHYNSPRSKGPLVKVSCAALPQDLIESELFGYEAGAFTGAERAKKGRFEMAKGGTLFLDEIGEVSRATQIKLLRVLQEREFEPLGSTQTVRADVRLITATNRDLERSIQAGDFREDLYYRLNVFPIFVPPLRERKPDVPQLANHFLEYFCRKHGKKVKRIATPAIDMLMSYHWPGNVRELENVIERGVVVCDTRVLHARHLPPTLQTAEASGTTITLSFEQATEAFEKDILQDALKSSLGNRAKAARLLKTTGRVFNYKVRKYKIDWRRFKR